MLVHYITDLGGSVEAGGGAEWAMMWCLITVEQGPPIHSHTRHTAAAAESCPARQFAQF